MAGLYKTIALFVITALALWYANQEDAGDRYPAIDALFWFCVVCAAGLSVRALVELVRVDRPGSDERDGGEAQ
jgi:hypothetical protein